MSAHTLTPFSPIQEAANGAFSPVIDPRPESMSTRRGSLVAAQGRPRTAQSGTPAVQAIAPPSALDNELPAPLYPALHYSNLPNLLANSPFKQRHVLSVRHFTHRQVHQLFTVAQEMRRGVEREGVLDVLKSKVLCTLFYEPSTRTSASFDAAMQRLGGRTIAIATTHSSTQKGETLADTLKTLACYGDAVVLRHPEATSVDVAAKHSPVPVINGGNGSVEHPTQAFLDLFTIREELGSVKRNMTITFAGDLRYGRTVHSLVRLLELYNETRTVRIQLVSPKALSLPADIRDELEKSGRLLAEAETLTPEIIKRTDVLYCTRVQKERFPSVEEYERLKDSIIVDNKVLKLAKDSMIILHPLPRNKEISEEVDYDPRAAYFRQMRYGLYIRMALLALVMA